MRKLITLLTAVLLISIASAQKITIGPIVGLNYSNLSFNESFINKGEDYTFITQNAAIGIAGGAFTRFEMKGFSIQPEILYSQDRSDIELSSQYKNQLQTITINKLQFPVLFGYNYKNVIRIQGGPVFSTFIDGSIVPSNATSFLRFKECVDKKAFGYQLGVGLEIRKMSFDLKWENEINPMQFQTQMSYNTFVFNQQKSAVQFTFGYKVFDKSLKRKVTEEQPLQIEPPLNLEVNFEE